MTMNREQILREMGLGPVWKLRAVPATAPVEEVPAALPAAPAPVSELVTTSAAVSPLARMGWDPRANYQLDRLERFDRSDQSRKRAEHAGLRARRRHFRRRRLGIQASVTRSAFGRVKNRRVALEAENRAVHQRLL